MGGGGGGGYDVMQCISTFTDFNRGETQQVCVIITGNSVTNCSYSGIDTPDVQFWLPDIFIT